MKNGLNTAVSSKILKQNAQTSAMILLLPWTKHNYTKFSATEVHFCIKLHQCGSTPKLWKQKIWWAVSVSNMHHNSWCNPRDTSAADIRQETPAEEGRRPPTEPPQPTWLTKHNSCGNQQTDVWWNKNLQTDKKPKEWKRKSAKIHVTLTSQS